MINGLVVGTSANIEFQANAIGNVTIVGDSAAGAVMNNTIFQAASGADAGSGANSIGNILVRNTDLAAASAVAASTAVATTASTGVGFAAEGKIGNVTFYSGQLSGGNYTGNGRLTLDATSGLLVASGDVGFGAGGTTVDAGVQVDVGNVRLVGDLVSQAGIAAAAGNGVVIVSGLKPTAAGNYDPSAVGFATNAVNSKIGTVDIYDTNAAFVDLLPLGSGHPAAANTSLIGAAEIGTLTIYNNSSTVFTQQLSLSGTPTNNVSGVDALPSGAINGTYDANEIYIVRV
jgi:hypothetical protein